VQKNTTNLMHSPKKWMKSLLARAGFQVSRISPYTDDSTALSTMFKHAHVDLVLDVGANIGQYAKNVIATGYTGRIVSFEPMSSARAELLSQAAAYPKWEVADQCALGDHQDTVTMHIAENSVASSILSATNAHLQYSPHAVQVAKEVVPMERLDLLAQPFIEKSQNPFLKIDVQGFEDQVLRGSTKILPKLVGLQVELSLIPIYEGQKLFPEMVSLITDMGFVLHRMMPEWIDQKTGRWWQADGVFFRR
jgi:FkbM family methyltransferase